ncbi:MAG: 2Fe-2S iron-sulfur cluster binding domain-containing protein [Thermodesulfobacteriota bacterium]
MLDLLIGLAIISAIVAFLAFLLEVADRYLADYGERHVLINEERDLKVTGGRSLLFTLADEGVFLPSACGGKGTCAYCKVQVMEGGGQVLPTETPYLTLNELSQHVRLACQLKVKEDLKVQVPDELFLVKEFRVRVEQIKKFTPDINFVSFRILSPAEGISFRAGQYVQLEVPKYELTAEPEFRAYSIASPPAEEHELGLLITRVPEGVVSTYVHEYLKEGDELTLRGPFGEFCLRESERELLMIATGSGLAPIRSMLNQIKQGGSAKKVTLFFGDRRPEDLLCYDEMLEFERTMANFTYVPTLSRTTEQDDWSGEKGRVTDLIKKYIPDNPPLDAYICGIPAMVHSCHDLLIKKGLPPERICFDKFE